MSVLTLEIPDKLFESLQAQAFKTDTTVEKLAIFAIAEKAHRDQLREDVLEGVEQLRNGQSTTYNNADEMMDDIIRRGNKILAERNDGNYK